MLQLQRRCFHRLNNVVEAYTGNDVDRKGVRSPLRLDTASLRIDAVGDGVGAPEAYTEEPLLVRLPRNCRGRLRAWYASREALKNLGDPNVLHHVPLWRIWKEW